jgi:tRNA(Arg) A34 adenosine deaminase TadA
MGRHKITATIYDKNGQVLSSASNNYQKSHPVQAKFAQQAGQPDRIYLHAEIHALTKLKKGERPYRIVIERYLKSGKPGSAKPCPVCEAAIKFYNLAKVEYTL